MYFHTANTMESISIDSRARTPVDMPQTRGRQAGEQARESDREVDGGGDGEEDDDRAEDERAGLGGRKSAKWIDHQSKAGGDQDHAWQ